MFHYSARHYIDTIIVIYSVIAGASSHATTINTITSSDQDSNLRYRASSFIEFLLDNSQSRLNHLIQLHNEDIETQYILRQRSTEAHFYHTRTICNYFATAFNDNQMKLCHKHQDIITSILPFIMELTQKECARISRDLKWNCTGIDYLLDRSNSLAFTKEAALIRSLLNASMMYLIVKNCQDGLQISCGCKFNEGPSMILSSLSDTVVRNTDHLLDQDLATQKKHARYNEINQLELSKLNEGKPLHITKLISRNIGCSPNYEFASALTKLLLESEDIRLLNKASTYLHEKRLVKNSRHRRIKSLLDSDERDLAALRWARSSVIIHNNFIGRKIVREARRRSCKCRGFYGLCLFKTCWDQPLDFDIITHRIRQIYLSNATQVELRDDGLPGMPELSLVKVNASHKIIQQHYSQLPFESKSIPNKMTHSAQIPVTMSDNLIYFQESPDYCEAQLNMDHPGTKGRPCRSHKFRSPDSNIMGVQVNPGLNATEATSYIEIRDKAYDNDPASCDRLCCGRGHISELLFDLVECDCSFKFCCTIECHYCLRQRVQHYCR